MDMKGDPANGYHGINIHRALPSGVTRRIERFSADCQVFEQAVRFDQLIALAKMSRDIRGDYFTYTLLDAADFG